MTQRAFLHTHAEGVFNKLYDEERKKLFLNIIIMMDDKNMMKQFGELTELCWGNFEDLKGRKMHFTIF